MKRRNRTKRYYIPLTQEQISAIVAAMNFTKGRTHNRGTNSWLPVDEEVLTILKLYQTEIGNINGK
jgi:hypothetical protein